MGCLTNTHPPQSVTLLLEAVFEEHGEGAKATVKVEADFRRVHRLMNSFFVFQILFSRGATAIGTVYKFAQRVRAGGLPLATLKTKV
jgi:hypothetical protein